MSEQVKNAINEIGDGVKELEERMATLAAASTTREEGFEAKFEEVRALSEAHAQMLADLKADMAERSLSLGMDNKDVEKYSITRAVRGFVQPDGNPEKHCPFELDVHRQLLQTRQDNLEHRMQGLPEVEMQRTMSTLTDGGGGFLVPEEVSGQMYDNYRASTVLGQAGVTNVQPGGFPFRLNKKTGNTTATRRGETSSVAASDVAFGQLSLTPKSLSARSVISQENVMWSRPAVDNIVEADIMESLTLKQDLDALVGAGGANTPIGLLNTTGVTNLNTGSGSGTAPTYAALGIELPLLVANANALIDDGTLNYVGTPGHVAMLRKQTNAVTTSGALNYILPPYGKPDDGSFLPYNWLNTTQIQGLGADGGASPAFFGRWSDLIHAMWGGLLIKRSDTATDGTNNALTEGWVHLVVMGWDDVGAVRPGAFSYDDTMDHA